jgi:septum site-determining protein MinC
MQNWTYRYNSKILEIDMTVATLTRDDEVCFQFKASFLGCTILQITHYDLEMLTRQLNQTISQAPNFFYGAPIIIDLEKVQNLNLLDFAELKQMLLAHGMMPIGVRGGDDEQHAAAKMVGLPILHSSKLKVTETPQKKPNEKLIPTKLVTTPIRSGMQIYAKESDLIVTTTVSPGAEVFADGNIHVYGPLRGRAMAGVQGNMQARIFCRSLEAELISIAGYYLTKEDIHIPFESTGMIQIFLEDAELRIQAI